MTDPMLAKLEKENARLKSLNHDAGAIIERLREAQKWIPVTERLPDWKDGAVLVFTKYGFSICKRTTSSRWMGKYACWITHWMPLPKKPKEE